MEWVFFENNTHAVWLDAKSLGGLDELEAARPKPRPIVSVLYSVFSQLRREAEDLKYIKKKDILDAVTGISYEPDLAVKVIQAADDFYLSLCVKKMKRMNKNG